MRETAFVARIDAILPQTQCTRCGFDGCLPYARAIASGEADIDRCPPGGDAAVAALAAVTGRAVKPVDAQRGVTGPLLLAVIDEAACIGCTLCIEACPVDAIIGAQKRMHAVLASLCSGCELCVAPCPVDCIAMRPARREWTRDDADAARVRHREREARVARNERIANRKTAIATDAARRKEAIAAALARARARRAVPELRRALFLALATITMNTIAAGPDFSAELDKLWDYAKPAVSEQRFRDALAKYPRDSREALETETQLARTQSLQRNFAEADKILDNVLPRLDRVPVRVKVRYFLERGRTRNSSGDRPAATALFHEALKLSGNDTLPGADDYRIDALHMLGIAAPADEQLDWNLKALAASEASSDPGGRRWAASLNNNIGWTYFDRGDYKSALAHWEKALALSEATGNVGKIRIAKWMVARGYRAVGRLDDAEKIQLALASERPADGEQSGYVFEELAELTYAKGDKDAAKAWAAKAYNLLRDDPDMAAETERLRRLLNLSQGRAP